MDRVKRYAALAAKARAAADHHRRFPTLSDAYKDLAKSYDTLESQEREVVAARQQAGRSGSFGHPSAAAISA